MRQRIFRWLAAASLLAGCATAPALTPEITPVVMQAAETSLPPPPEPAPTHTPTPQPSPTATIAPTSTPDPASLFDVFSPLEGITIAELREILTTPFQPPKLGRDDGHHGVDLAYYSRGERGSIEGLPIFAPFAGLVAGRVDDRYPYGNMIIIETPLSALPEALQEKLTLQLQPTPAVPDARLTCPAWEGIKSLDYGALSVYVLAAHMAEATPLLIGETVAGGQQVGLVGNTGGSGNPHLHLEIRLGPAGGRFDSMSHYRNNLPEAEMANYCAWRTSGAFQLLDPLWVLEESAAWVAAKK
ncbi:MAG TPA: M23 family metallopeptidase [Anaerolineaceae bacterium]|nr:M23 family metallopeptidase [Anaerolineaceae bacterium]HPN52939.1 M23 family metallopeptidase [Anaerolineaceae bacterium]